MSKQFINFNSEIFPSDHPVIPISNRSFKYGDGLFESMRYIKGDLKFVDLHVDRLRKGMKILKMEDYSQVDSYFLREKTEELVRRNKTGLNARVRFTAFRNADGFYNPSANKMGYALEVSKLADPAYSPNAKGLIIDVYDEVSKPVNILSNLKTNNSLIYVLAGVFKNQHSLDEVLILNQHGFLCEAMSSNVFVVYEKQLYTPSLSEGCIAGVMRKVVMRLAKENNLKLTEAQINPEILNQAEEVFLTNASMGIQWVMGYNTKRYFNETSRFLLSKLNLL